MSDGSNRDLVYCPPCRKAGRDSVLRLASVGFLGRLRSVSYACDACDHVTAVSLRRGAMTLPDARACWNCSVATEPMPARCPSCGLQPDILAAEPDPMFFTFPKGEPADLLGLSPAELTDRLAAARRERRLEAALGAADALTRAAPGDPAGWRSKADLYLEHGFLPLALAATKRALALAPGDVDTVLALVTVLELLDELEAATGMAAHAMTGAPRDPRPHAAMASLLDRQERYDEAEAAARQAVALDAGRADAWATLATLAMRRKDFAAGARAWQQVLAAAVDFPLAWRYQALCHLALGDWPAAIATADRCPADDEEGHEVGFEARLGQGDAASALAHADRCLEPKPESTRFLYCRARALMALGRRAEGLAVCERIVTLAPDAEWAKKARAAFAARLAAAGA